MFQSIIMKMRNIMDLSQLELLLKNLMSFLTQDLQTYGFHPKIAPTADFTANMILPNPVHSRSMEQILQSNMARAPYLDSMLMITLAGEATL